MSARSSDSIRHIAKALAAAQCDLQNPQARHEGQIRRELPSGLALIEPYRFASLGDGLALIRPILGRHGLSLIQATRLDGQAGLVILETRIIHESGEWILADYPVAPLPHGGASDPRELGAALTYARRQSLFSLIGIAPQNDPDGCVGAGLPAGDHDASRPIAGSKEPVGQLIEEISVKRCAHDRRDMGDRTNTGASWPADGSFPKPLTPLDLARTSDDQLAALSEELERLSSLKDLRSWAMDRVKVIAPLLPQDRRRLNEAFLARRKAVDQQVAHEGNSADRLVDEDPNLEKGAPAIAGDKGTTRSERPSRPRSEREERTKNGSRRQPVLATDVPAAGPGQP
ncbi:ERF family protein [Phreatobacter oligotrophus]|uniref:ERF superfamily protein n=1 Tax=Phreatobacter oligotrophus TaxID=1122261 RepID=A0A2T4YYZ3_9HYPH|nr:ERF family protein [Phreatobacter oligotrophus]MBX9992981.1 ERF family protein [Phreatobacter oligotrophus]PTM52208.1 ERF superfamily protein [Phreatobacter oligotrophus]